MGLSFFLKPKDEKFINFKKFCVQHYCNTMGSVLEVTAIPVLVVVKASSITAVELLFVHVGLAQLTSNTVSNISTVGSCF